METTIKNNTGFILFLSAFTLIAGGLYNTIFTSNTLFPFYYYVLLIYGPIIFGVVFCRAVDCSRLFKSRIWIYFFGILIVGSFLLPYHVDKYMLKNELLSLNRYPGMSKIKFDETILLAQFSGSNSRRVMWVIGDVPITVTDKEILDFYKADYEQKGWDVDYEKTIASQIDFDRLVARKGNSISKISFNLHTGMRDDGTIVLDESTDNPNVKPETLIFQSVTHYIKD